MEGLGTLQLHASHSARKARYAPMACATVNLPKRSCACGLGSMTALYGIYAGRLALGVFGHSGVPGSDKGGLGALGLRAEDIAVWVYCLGRRMQSQWRISAKATLLLYCQ